MITIDSSLERLYRLALRRKLKIEQAGCGEYRVSSFSNPGWWHFVRILEGKGSCSCQENLPEKACSHLALAAAEDSVSLWLEFEHIERARFAKSRLKVLTGKRLTKRERALVAEGKALNLAYQEITTGAQSLRAA